MKEPLGSKKAQASTLTGITQGVLENERRVGPGSQSVRRRETLNQARQVGRRSFHTAVTKCDIKIY